MNLSDYQLCHTMGIITLSAYMFFVIFPFSSHNMPPPVYLDLLILTAAEDA